MSAGLCGEDLREYSPQDIARIKAEAREAALHEVLGTIAVYRPDVTAPDALWVCDMLDQRIRKHIEEASRG